MTATFDIKAKNTQKPVNIVRDWLYDVILHKAGTQNYVCIYGNTSGCLCG